MEFTLEIHESELNKLLKIFNIKFKDFAYIIVSKNEDEGNVKLNVSSSEPEENNEMLSDLYETIFEDFETANIKEIVSAESPNEGDS